MENNVIEIDVAKKLISAGGVINLQVLQKFNFGELSVLFGASGAGKTTLLRILAGLTKPDRGFIKAGDTVWLDTGTGVFLPPQKRNIGFVFQDFALFPNMSVSRNIAFGCNGDKSRVNYLIGKFGLNEFAHRKPEKLSGGQKQRVAWPGQLAANPQFLFLDEPLSALDAKIRSELQEELQKLKREEKNTI
ncbi:MAG: ATP-binding cassette domain-containing protein [Bacteroidales bacterium]|nr:ATP-binding cassette domain-containing protein [Bacteroidales bacterium]